MKRHLLTVLSVLLIMTFSCSYRDTKKKEEKKINDTIQSNKYAESSAIKTVTAFLKWYKDNYVKVNDFDLVNNCTTNSDSTKYYSVNFKQTELYLRYIDNSKFVSGRYITKWRNYFNECEKDFKKNPQNDGPPEGFDYDFILRTQEIDETLALIDKPKTISVNIKENSGTVCVDVYMKLKFHLTKENNKWLIDDIENIPFASKSLAL